MFRVIGLYLFSLLFFLAGVGHFIMDGFFCRGDARMGTISTIYCLCIRDC